MPLRRPAELNVTPVGGVPEVMLKVGAGLPEAVIWNEPSEPKAKLVLDALVIVGDCWTVRLTVFDVVPDHCLR